ncbi:hypothetical protein DEAC_c39940 [Desulfosporosinus acididurans]|uniref:Uncharacterized protein n=1 Tax=Desulfosporosinus acididurans TaxID=476652 RepID=A0A0J1FKK1_9FIRM|nr:hypothetical protein [Desulfosporosinus acididurans]KLU64000.1 hypothetical protein DEAC_c39940 [Desulfosporosinus acididurans]
MDTNVIMLLISLGSLIVGSVAGLGINFLVQKGKDPKVILSTADTVLGEAKALNDDIGKVVLPAPLETIIDKVIQVSQAGVHSAEQRCNSDQITKDQKNQNAYDAAMNMLKIAGYEPTPEIQKAVKDMIETGVFDMNSSSPSVETVPAVPDQAVSQAIASKVQQVVTPIATQAANDAVQQAISQTVQAFPGAVSSQAAQSTSDTQLAQTDSQAQTQQPA